MNTEYQHYSSDELYRKYGQHNNAELIFDFWSLGQALSECVIEDNYKSTSLGSISSNLTNEGAAIRKEFMKKLIKETEKNSTFAPNPNDANLLSFLTLFHNDLLINVEATDLDVIADTIGKEITERKLLFPFSFGRDLYDRVQEIQKTEVRKLSYADTIEILKNSPIGVFQVGCYLFGPFGLVKTEFRRSIPPRRDLPLQYSSDRTNRSAHRVWLTSSMRAPVNADRPVFEEALRTILGETSDWAGFFRKISITNNQDYNANSEASIPYFLGDAFSTYELILIAHYLNMNGSVHKAIPSEFLEQVAEIAENSENRDSSDIERSKLIQCIMSATDADIRQVIDNLVFQKKIVVPAGEVRVPVLSGKKYLGQWGTHFELGHLGTRVVGVYPGLPQLRLKNLLHSAYNKLGGSYQENLAWALQNTEGILFSDKLEKYISTLEPAEVLRKTILPYNDASKFAFKYVDLDITRLRDSQANFAEYAELLTWRLGFNEKQNGGAYLTFMKAQSDAIATMPSSTDEVDYLIKIRGAVAHLFTSLETYLKQLLAFLTWALMSDHYRDENPFQYTLEKAQIFANGCLFQNSSKEQSISMMTLQPLLDGFMHLCNLLDSPDATKEHMRVTNDFPTFSKKTDLQTFPLKHDMPFFDLRDKAKTDILSGIRQFIRTLKDARITEIRNDFSHGGLVTLPDLNAVRSCVESIRSSIQQLELAGLGLSISDYLESVSDPWGRAKHKLVNEAGVVITLQEPSDCEFIRLPTPHRSQIILAPAIFETSNEPLRFSISFDSEYSKYWRGFPYYPEPSEILGIEGNEPTEG